MKTAHEENKAASAKASAKAADINRLHQPRQQAPLFTEPLAGGAGSVPRLGDALLAGGFELHPSLGGTSEGSRIEGIPSAASAQTSDGWRMVAVSIESSRSLSDEDCSVDYG